MGLLDFEKQLVFYGQYHSNPINKLIHVIFVPTIAWSLLVWLNNTPAFMEWDYSAKFPLNGSFILVTSYVSYYSLLEPIAGILYAPILYTLHHCADAFLQHYPTDANTWAGYIFVASWIFQFMGHGFAEKRAPALLDSLVQALLLAPLFVFMEVLFVFGYRPALKARLQKTIDAEIAKWKASKAKSATTTSAPATRPSRRIKKAD